MPKDLLNGNVYFTHKVGDTIVYSYLPDLNELRQYASSNSGKTVLLYESLPDKLTCTECQNVLPLESFGLLERVKRRRCKSCVAIPRDPVFYTRKKTFFTSSSENSQAYLEFSGTSTPVSDTDDTGRPHTSLMHMFPGINDQFNKNMEHDFPENETVPNGEMEDLSYLQVEKNTVHVKKERSMSYSSTTSMNTSYTSSSPSRNQENICTQCKEVNERLKDNMCVSCVKFNSKNSIGSPPPHPNSSPSRRSSSSGIPTFSSPARTSNSSKIPPTPAQNFSYPVQGSNVYSESVLATPRNFSKTYPTAEESSFYMESPAQQTDNSVIQDEGNYSTLVLNEHDEAIISTAPGNFSSSDSVFSEVSQKSSSTSVTQVASSDKKTKSNNHTNKSVDSSKKNHSSKKKNERRVTK